MAAQEWLYGLLLYFSGCFIVVSLFSIAGVFQQGEFSATQGFDPTIKGAPNGSEMPTGITSTYSVGRWLADVFSFFVWNISIGADDSVLYEYFWLVRVVLVIVPLIMLVIALWFSLPTMGGGGG